MRKRVLILLPIVLFFVSLGVSNAANVKVYLRDTMRIELDSTFAKNNLNLIDVSRYDYSLNAASKNVICSGDTVFAHKKKINILRYDKKDNADGIISNGDELHLSKIAYLDLPIRKDMGDVRRGAACFDLKHGESITFPICWLKSIKGYKDVPPNFNTDVKVLNPVQLFPLYKYRNGELRRVGTYKLFVTAHYNAACKTIMVTVARGGSAVDEDSLGAVRSIELPQTAGVTHLGGSGVKHVSSGRDFKFTVNYTGGKELEVTTNRVKDDKKEVLKGVKNSKGEYEYVIPVVQENIELTFGDEVVSNLMVAPAAVWSNGNSIFINVEGVSSANVYGVTGQLQKQVVLPPGLSSIHLPSGIYLVALKDGSVHKVILK